MNLNARARSVRLRSGKLAWKKYFAALIAFCLAVTSSPGYVTAEEGAADSAVGTASVNASGANPGSISPSGSADNFLFTGSFLYQIPIAVPPGIAGMEPQLALQYNSSSQNGWLGVGWDLSLGAIQRSTKNGRPSYTGADTFVVTMKGQTFELVQIADGSYRAKTEGAFQKFFKEGIGWRAVDKTGTQFFFGQNASSRITHTEGTFLWALNEIRDRNANKMTASYQSLTTENQIYLHRIFYTENGTAGKSPSNMIQFTVEPHGAASVLSLSAGFPITTAHALSKIEAFHDGAPAGHYEFSYGTSMNSGRPLLKTVRRFGLDGATTFPPITLHYQDENQPPAFVSHTDLAGSDWSSQSDHIVPGDFNGDSKTDYLFFRDETYSPHQQNNVVYLSNGDGSFNLHWGFSDYNFFGDENVVSGDFNNDGRTDLFIYRSRNPAHPGAYPNDQSRLYLANADGSFQYISSFPGQNIQNDQAARRVIAADFNGDGATDLAVYSLLNHTSALEISNGDGTFTPSGVLPIENWSYSTEVIPGDFNGDGKADLLIYTNNNFQGWAGNKENLWLSNGDGTFVKISSDLPGSDFTSTEDRVYVADVNGDRLADMLLWRDLNFPGADGLHVFLSQGNGSFFGAGIVEGSERATQSRYWTFADYNGDGMTDLIRIKPDAPGSHHLFRGEGNGEFTDDGQGPSSDINGGTETVLPVDVDGNGKTDLLTLGVTGPQAGLRLDRGSDTHPDLLTRVENGIGGETRITYRSSRQFSNRNLPFSVPVVDSVQSLDGRCLTHLDECPTTSYFYEGGYFDKSNKEFLGFRTVTAKDLRGVLSRSHFLQDRGPAGAAAPENAFKGRVWKTETFNPSGGLLRSQETDWERVEPWPGVHFVRVRKTRSYNHETSPPEAVETEIFYDDAPGGPGLGNPIRTEFYGDPSVAGDEKTQFTEYAYNETAYLAAFPSRTEWRGPSNDLLSAQEFYYDGNTTPGVVSKGNATEVRVWLDLPTPRWIATQTEFNEFGQAEVLIDALGRRSETLFDDNGYPIQVSNPLGHTVQSAYNPKNGNTESDTDVNGVTTHYRYDMKGRLTKVIGPNDTEALPSVEYDYHDELLGNPQAQFIEKRVREVSGQPETLWSKTYLDGQGRAYKTEMEDTVPLVSQTVFDNRGQAVKTSLPYHQNDPAILWVEKVYDDLGRTVEVIQPDQTRVLTEYQGRTTRVTDPLGRIHTSVTDAWGRPIERWEPAVSAPTRYDYDPQDNLIRVTDSQGLQTHFSYDSLNRKLSMTDPNAGTWQYEYDDSGNLLRQIDPRSVAIAMTYDDLDRLTQKTLEADPLSATGQTPGVVLSSYLYDETNNRPYSTGRLTTQQDLSGLRYFYHDRLGRLIKETREIDGVYYDFLSSYDALDRLQTFTYPNSEALKYEYDGAGRLTRVINQNSLQEYASFEEFDAQGRPKRLIQGGLASTEFTYDPLKQTLSRLKSTRIGTSEVFQDLAYQFNTVGNLTQLTDALKPERTQTFSYDALNRLIQANGLYGTEAYSYDDLGNFHDKGNLTYAYEDALHPYAVTGTALKDDKTRDASTVLAWGFDRSENIFELSGAVTDESAQPVTAADVRLLGLAKLTAKPDTQGYFKFKGVAGGAVESVGAAAPGFTSNPSGYAFNPLTETRSDLDFILQEEEEEPGAGGLAHTRTTFGGGTPAPGLTSGSMEGGTIQQTEGSGASLSDGGSMTLHSGYSPLPDDATASTSGSPSPLEGTVSVIGPDWAEGVSGDALLFDGTNDIFVFPDSQAHASGSFTLMGWARPETFPSVSTSTILSKGILGQEGFHLGITPSGHLAFQVAGSSPAVSASPVSLKKWSFLSASYDGNDLSLFINGQLAGSIPAGGASPSSNAPLTAGAGLGENFTPVNGAHFHGRIDEPRLHARAWTAPEILEAYRSYQGAGQYAYDAAGNMTTKTTAGTTSTYRWDAEGRLAAVSDNEGTIASFVYDAAGDRVKKTAKGETTVYVNGIFEVRPDGSHLMHIAAGGQRVADILFPPGGGGEAYYPLTDHLGSTALVLNQQGDVVQDLAYTPFGELLLVDGSSPVERLYTGQIYDGVIQEYYYNARFLNPQLGRFISADNYVQNLGDIQTLNRYAYVRNNPLVFTDPTGHFIDKVLAAAFPSFAPSLSYNVLSGNVNNSEDWKRYSYQAAVYNVSVPTAIYLSPFAAKGVTYLINGAEIVFPGGFTITWEQAGYSLLLSGIGYGLDSVGVESNTTGYDSVESYQASYNSSRARNVNYHLSSKRTPSRRALTISLAEDENPIYQGEFASLGDDYSRIALGFNYGGLSAITLGGPAGIPAAAALGLSAGVFDTAASLSYFADYRLTGNERSKRATYRSLVGVGLDVGTANIGAVAAKRGLHTLRYSEKLTGRYLSNAKGYYLAIRPYLQSIIYGHASK